MHIVIDRINSWPWGYIKSKPNPYVVYPHDYWYNIAELNRLRNELAELKRKKKVTVPDFDL